MRRISFLLLALAFLQFNLHAQEWKMVEGKITTPWAEKVDPSGPLPEYPRPQLVRPQWANLNGPWQYAILPIAQQEIPSAMQGDILVPFAVESALSGVGKTVGKDSVLWYKRTVQASKTRNKRLLLHFGAVDWDCTVYVNGKEVGTHKGGYDPFTIDITDALKKGSRQDIAVRVWDPSDDGPQPRGKQVKNPSGIWYTPVTGIWQTVWLETVPQTYIAATRQTPDIDEGALKVLADVENAVPGDEIVLTVWDGNSKIAEQRSAAAVPSSRSTLSQRSSIFALSLSIPDPKLWSPKQPFLYDLTVTLQRKGKTVDEAKSYFAMRKISMQPDKNGIQRMLLNNEFVFQYGPLDQGWWPDGLYTAPTDEALKFDIVKTQEMGFNMIRKHVKVEPARWYYHCDQLGMLVWQDMPSGDLGNQWQQRPGVYGGGTDRDRTPESEAIFRTEWKEIMQDFHNFPSIVVWVPFNEAWGQFKTREIVEWTTSADPSRLINSASGGNFEPVGHIIDLHNYPDPVMPRPDLFGEKQVLVLGEFGGLGLPVENHTWQEKNNWGYRSFTSKEALLNKYTELMDRFPDLIAHGLSAAVYTQTTDVEIEVNGMMTYDRKVIKIPEEKLRALHQKLYDLQVEMK